MQDIIGQIGAVVREVGRREHEGKPARVMVASRSYDAEIEEVWDALTNRDRIPRWFLPISGDLRLGGRYQLEGNAGGTITRCDAPRRLAATWEFGGEVSWVDVELSEASNGSTDLKLEHIAHVDDERWAQYGPGAVGVGWDMSLLGLHRYLSTGEGKGPETEADLTASAEGKAFMRASSEEWRDASVADGTDKSEATAAAKRTTAFYTGEEEE